MSWRQALDQALPSGAVFRTCESLALDPEPRNVAIARQFVADNVPELEPDIRERLLLLTSELATNVVVHARTPMIVAVGASDDDVVVGVHDQDLGRREIVVRDRDGGRGLALVVALSCSSGQTRHPEGGKTSWFRLCLVEDGESA